MPRITNLLNTVAVSGAMLAIPAILHAQDRLASMPGHAQYQALLDKEGVTGGRGGRAGGGGGRGGGGTPLFTSGAVSGVDWAADDKSFTYSLNGTAYRFDMATKASTVAADVTPAGNAGGRGGAPGGRGNGRGGGGGAAANAQMAALLQACKLGNGAVDRGRQAVAELSPDGKQFAFYRDRNLWITATSDASCGSAKAITLDGSEKTRIKYGTASWVYGEELEQRDAFGWSPDGSKLWYYRFDESQIPDFYTALNQRGLQDSLEIEAYPKAGVPNPVVNLFVYNVAASKSTEIDVRDGKPFTNDVVGHYVYHVAFSPDQTEITFNRKNRRQNILEFTACAVSTGKCRVVVHEDWPTGWLENHNTAADMQWMADQKRFVWTSERNNGYANYYMYDFKTGKLLNTITNNQFEAMGTPTVDEKAGVLWYTAADGDNFMKQQLHRVNLDGTGEKRITDPAWNHRVDRSPDGKYFVDVAQTHDQAPVSRVLDANGAVIAELAKSDLSRMNELGVKKVEMFEFTSADGHTKLYGSVEFPSYFDPNKKYPIIVGEIYGGPATNNAAPTENFTTSRAQADYGFLYVKLHTRASLGMGKKSLDQLYLKLGATEIDDMAAGVKSLFARRYVDSANVGIYGTSYGGYSSLMALVRYPHVFSAAAAQSPPTDWRNYDTIYTERYMWLPQENKQGYDFGSTVTYADSLKGALMLYFGTADNNVHPNNSLQMISALQRAGKHFEMQIGPDAIHSSMNADRMMEFFIQNLKMHLVANGN